METKKSIFETYNDEMAEDTHLDEMVIRDKQMKLPAIKHKWVARLVRTRARLRVIEAERTALIETLSKEALSSSEVRISTRTAEGVASKHSRVVSMDAVIQEEKEIIDYLIRVEKIFDSMTWDIKNAIELMKLETT